MGRHQAPARHRRKSAGGSAPQPAAATPPPAAPPPTPQPPQRQQPPASWPPTPPGPPPRPAPPIGEEPGLRLASWWLLLETGTLALVIAIVGILVYAANIVVDGLEIIVGAGLLLAPILVRHVVLRVHRRWTALVVAYLALLAIAFAILVVGDLVTLHTVAGFGAGALGVMAAGAAFVFASRLFAPRQQQVQAPSSDAPAVPPPPPTAHAPVSAPAFHPTAPDESDTDTLPQVIPHSDDREDDSLAG